MERPRTKTKLMLGNGFMGSCQSTYLKRWIGDLTCTKYELCSTNKVGDHDYGALGGPSYINTKGELL